MPNQSRQIAAAMIRTGSPRQLAVLCALLVGVTLATFWPVLHHEFINFDDPDYVTENDWVKGGMTEDGVKWAFTTGHASNWHPMTWLSHMLDVSLFGLKPMGHHAMNLLFHAANSMLLLLLLYQMTGAVWRSAFVTALFACHPLHVESVAWVAERKDVLSTFFGLLCLLAYAKYARTKAEKAFDTAPDPLPGRGGEGGHRHAPVWYAMALVFLALGLMSKPMLVTWPLVMLLLDFWPLERATSDGGPKKAENVTTPHPTLSPNETERASEAWTRLVVEKLPFLALVVGSCAVTLFVQAKGGTVTTAGNLPLGDRSENAVVSYVKYLGKTIWPTDLAIFYPHPETRYPISEQWPLWLISLASLLLVGISILVLRQFRERPFLATGWFWYLGTLVPVIGIVQVGAQAMADRYTYIPLIGIFIIVAWSWAELTTRFPFTKTTITAVGVIVLIGCAVVSRIQAAHWQNSFTIFQHAVAVTRNNAPALGNLGTEYVKRGELEQAGKHFKAALEADPHFADAGYNLGWLEQQRGNLEAAVGYYQDALQRRPDHVLSHHNLGTVLWLQGRTSEAETQFRETLSLKPDHLEANANLGNLLLELRRPAESQTSLTTALHLKPGYTYARLGLGLAFKMQGQLPQAEEQLRQVITAEPENLEAALNLAVVLTDLGMTNEAVPFLAQVTRAKPQLCEELLLSGQALGTQGKVEAAVDQLAAAVCLKPVNTTAIQFLAQLQAQSGRLDDAARNYERALSLAPSAEAHYYLAVIHALQTNAPAAVTNFRQALQLKPDYLAALNELAWLFATHPDEKIRNGEEAVSLAKRACNIGGDTEARYWGTLDAAYAEAGRFPEAIQTAEKTRTLALAAGQPELAGAAASRRELYLNHKPYRQ
jgi:protein O-mannosyl-transferase